jgi:hypothetical protein
LKTLFNSFFKRNKKTMTNNSLIKTNKNQVNLINNCKIKIKLTQNSMKMILR